MKFVAQGHGRGISAKKATRVFDLIQQFAGYGFNESQLHGVARLAYQTAYLKVELSRALHGGRC